MNDSTPHDSSGHRHYLRSATLEEFQDSDLYSALLFAAGDTMNASLSVAERAIAAARKNAAMKEIERREAPPRSRRTPSCGIGKARSAPVER